MSRSPGDTTNEVERDPFDRLYDRWAEHAFSKRQNPPTRQMWDRIVLRLIMSRDPERVRLYRRIEAQGPDSLGGDAYDLWRKIPPGTPGAALHIRDWSEFDAYEQAQRGSMRPVMEQAGLGDRYSEILAAHEARRRAPDNKDGQDVVPGDNAARSTQARRAQMNMMLVGCVGLGAIAFMVLTVLLIIALKMAG